VAHPAVDRFARVVWPTEAPIDEGRVRNHRGGTAVEAGAEELDARIASPLAQIAATLRAIHEQGAAEGGRPFSLPNGANAAGTADVLYDGPRPGNLWRVELVAVSVAAAAAAGILEAFIDTADESNIAGLLGNLQGNTPSRGFLALPRPAVVFGGQPFIARVSGIPAGAQVTCRIQGENQVLGED
jgi:hypothetical protein